MVHLPPKEFHIYCDESYTEHRFMVFGGIVIPSRDLEKFDTLVNAWRVKHNMTAELKWTKLTDQRFEMYRSLIDLFFAKASSNRDGFHFKAAVFDMSQVNYRKQFGGNKELGFYNFYRFSSSTSSASTPRPSSTSFTFTSTTARPNTG